MRNTHPMCILRHAIIVVITSIIVMGCSNRVELLQGVSEGEANEALAALLESGVKATKLPGKDGMVGLEVESSEVARSIAILRAEGLPKERYAKMGEVFRKEGLISSPLEERARYLWALSQELSATISQIDGVIKARVHVVLPERSSSSDPTLPSSAAVFIKHKSGVMLDDSVPQIKRLVANSIPGLSADKVTVVLLPAVIKMAEESEKNSSTIETKSRIAASDAVEFNYRNFESILQNRSAEKVGFWIIYLILSVLTISLIIYIFIKNKSVIFNILNFTKNKKTE